MKTIKEYIRITEALDEDNLYFKIDTFFKNNEQERNDFSNIVSKYKANEINKDDIKNCYGSIDTVSFVDFMLDNIDKTQEGIDYDYTMQKIVDTIVADKSERNPFANI